MADKRYVNIPAVATKETFDNKYKSIWPKKVQAALVAAINGSSKLTTEPPEDKKAPGFYAAGQVALRKTDKGVEAEVQVVLADWPGKKMFRTEISKADTPVPNPAKIDQKVTDIMEGILENIPKNVVKTLEGKVK